MYTEDDEDGDIKYVNAVPGIGAEVEALPANTTSFEKDGVTYYQFDIVFFVAKEGKYEVVDDPDAEDGG